MARKKKKKKKKRKYEHQQKHVQPIHVLKSLKYTIVRQRRIDSCFYRCLGKSSTTDLCD